MKRFMSIMFSVFLALTVCIPNTLAVTPMTKEKQVYDYSACMFPEGVLSSDKNLVFNHDQIQVINHMGLENEEYKLFNNKVKDIISNVGNMQDLKFSSINQNNS